SVATNDNFALTLAIYRLLLLPNLSQRETDSPLPPHSSRYPIGGLLLVVLPHSLRKASNCEVCFTPSYVLQGKKMVAKGFTVDLNKPLVFQVGHLGEDYNEWIHEPIVSKEGPRLFGSDFWESLTRTVWWAIPTIWVPVACFSISRSAQMGLTAPELASIVIFGILLWTLMEYTIHRFLFHIKTKTYWGNTMHYLLHGIHHKHPMDGLRLVFPPAATAVLLVPLWNLFKAIATPSTAPALFGGVLLGYVMYDITHYYLHHAQPIEKIPKNLKKYHLNHHFRIHDKGFGITSSLWDMVFGTLPPSYTPAKVQQVQ
ncbi:hypothetical protein V2J09_005807, partial [Rumex salicifolius]